MRVHDVLANVRVARMSDAIVRGARDEVVEGTGAPGRARTDGTDREGGAMDRITLRSMRFEGRLGATDEERELPQLVEVDLEVEADLTAAGESDALADTVDYGPLVALVDGTVEGGAFHLLEGLASAIARRALDADRRIHAVTVRVRKLAVPLDVDMDHAEVEIRRGRAAG